MPSVISSLRKVSKLKLRDFAKSNNYSLARALQLLPRQNEQNRLISYWLNYHDVDAWMRELSSSESERFTTHDGCYVTTHQTQIILDESNLLSLKMELTFGSLKVGYSPALWRMVSPDQFVMLKDEDVLCRDIDYIDKAIRTVRNNRSYVYYKSSTH